MRARTARHASFSGTIPCSAAAINSDSTRGSCLAASATNCACRADSRPSRTAASVSGNRSKHFAVAIARRASLVSTPTARAYNCAASRSAPLRQPAVSATRCTAFASTPSASRWIMPISVTNRVAWSCVSVRGSKLAASSSIACLVDAIVSNTTGSYDDGVTVIGRDSSMFPGASGARSPRQPRPH
jgi:hypothetical protein